MCRVWSKGRPCAEGHKRGTNLRCSALQVGHASMLQGRPWPLGLPRGSLRGVPAVTDRGHVEGPVPQGIHGPREQIRKVRLRGVAKNALQTQAFQHRGCEQYSAVTGKSTQGL